MKKIIAISVAGLAALAFSSCTCPACGGSGLQIRTNSGWAATPVGAQAGTGHETRTCVRCKGQGREFGLQDGLQVLKAGTDTARDVKHLSN